jgi:hypothetical protein
MHHSTLTAFFHRRLTEQVTGGNSQHPTTNAQGNHEDHEEFLRSFVAFVVQLLVGG